MLCIATILVGEDAPFSFRKFNVVEAMCKLLPKGDLRRICLNTGNRVLIVDAD